MSRGAAPRVFTVLTVVTLLAALVGFITTVVLNAFVLDEYDAYGEVPIPGSSSLNLPEGEVLITFHTMIIGGGNGGLPVPAMSIKIAPPDGVPDPDLTEDIGGTTTVNNDARVRVWVAQIPAEGTYVITTDGKVSAYLNPTLAFGHASRYGHLPVVFAVAFGIALVGLLIVRAWAARVAQRVSTVGYPLPPQEMSMQPADPYTPTDQGIRLQHLETLAQLRGSGALTEEEYESEKKRVLDGL
jgi:hypothetical protein